MFTTYVKFLIIISILGFPLNKGLSLVDKKTDPFGLEKLFKNEDSCDSAPPLFKSLLQKLDKPNVFKILKTLIPKPSSPKGFLDSLFDEIPKDELTPLLEPVSLYPEPSLHVPETNVLEVLETFEHPPVIKPHFDPILTLSEAEYYPEGWREYYLGILEKLAVDVTDVLPDECC